MKQVTSFSLSGEMTFVFDEDPYNYYNCDDYRGKGTIERNPIELVITSLEANLSGKYKVTLTLTPIE